MDLLLSTLLFAQQWARRHCCAQHRNQSHRYAVQLLESTPTPNNVAKQQQQQRQQQQLQLLGGHKWQFVLHMRLFTFSSHKGVPAQTKYA
ncbi:unnamed protein product [Ceratitis capitata]|uniref:(Mediterranean fruit fly) hypothetical protein n=1 Tax=Ceratitis capitata TaxID=7213 RepID=A0A811UG21_CERCA|nr:unnamed protein product [Ceratitis capitata]